MADLAKIKYVIDWRNDDPATAKVQIAEFTPSPLTHNVPSKQQLVEFSDHFGDHIVAWCLHREGEQVGSGECWDLARDALLKGCGNHAFVSTYYHHGFPILTVHGTPSGPAFAGSPADEVRKGDILQFTLAKFEDKATGATQTAGAPNHTSVVIGKVGEKIQVAEQNVGGVRKVMRGEYTLGHITNGSVIVYRPVPMLWAGA